MALRNNHRVEGGCPCFSHEIRAGSMSTEAMPKRILVIENYSDLQNALKWVLEEAGYKYYAAFNGQEGLDMICREHYDLLIANYMLPKLNGLEMCKRIREAGIKVPIIICDASYEKEFITRAMDCGANTYLLMPFEVEDLLKMIKYFTSMEDMLDKGARL